MDYSQQPTCNQPTCSTDQARTFEQSDEETSIRAAHDREHPYVMISRELAQARGVLSWAARAVMLYLISKPRGWRLNVQDLRNEGGCGREQIYSILKELQEAGYLKRIEHRNDRGVFVRHIYVWYESLADNPDYQTPPPAPPSPIDQPRAEQPPPDRPQTDPLPENPEVVVPLPGNPDAVQPEAGFQDAYKRKNSEKKELTKNTHIQTTAPAAPKPVGVCSRFSKEEIKRYVEHCRAKGDPIHNPPALANSLYRTGTSDAYIEAFLYPDAEPSAATPQAAHKGKPIDTQPCSDCYGAGFWYPQGFEHGVAKCQHPRLAERSTDA